MAKYHWDKILVNLANRSHVMIVGTVFVSYLFSLNKKLTLLYRGNYNLNGTDKGKILATVFCLFPMFEIGEFFNVNEETFKTRLQYASKSKG